MESSTLNAALADTVQLTVATSGDPGDPAWVYQSEGPTGNPSDGAGAATIIGAPAGLDQLNLVGQLLARGWREADRGVDEFGQPWTTFLRV